MKKKINQPLILILVAVTFFLALGSEKNWLQAIAISLNFYYFFFLVNQFRKMYEKENFLIKIFINHAKAPMYLATLTIVAIIILERSDAAVNFNTAYTSVVIGFVVGIIALVKPKLRQSNN